MMRANGGNQPYNPVFEDFRMNFRNYTPMSDLHATLLYQHTQRTRAFTRAHFPCVVAYDCACTKECGLRVARVGRVFLTRGHTRSPPTSIFN